MRFRLLPAILLCLPLCGQQTTPENPQPKPPASVSATTRLLNAKTVYLKNAGGSDTPFEIVNNAIVGWPRYTVVDDLDKADLLIEVSSPEDPNKKKDDSGGTKIQGNSGSGRDPRALQVPTNTYSTTDVKLLVRDAHTKAVLWAGTEPAHEAFRAAKTEENMIEATQKLLHRFHDRIEPPPPPQ